MPYCPFNKEASMTRKRKKQCKKLLKVAVLGLSLVPALAPATKTARVIYIGVPIALEILESFLED